VSYPLDRLGRDRHGIVSCELSHSEVGRRTVTAPAIHPPVWPKTHPKAEAIHTTAPPGKTKNTNLDAGQVAIVGTDGTDKRTAMTPPRTPVRSPTLPGFTARVAAIAPPIVAPMIITAPPTVASEFGN